MERQIPRLFSRMATWAARSLTTWRKSVGKVPWPRTVQVGASGLVAARGPAALTTGTPFSSSDLLALLATRAVDALVLDAEVELLDVVLFGETRARIVNFVTELI